MNLLHAFTSNQHDEGDAYLHEAQDSTVNSQQDFHLCGLTAIIPKLTLPTELRDTHFSSF